MKIDLKASNNKIFLKDCGDEKTYAELHTNIMQASEALRNYSIHGIVVVQINKRFDFAAITLALSHTGHSILLINPSYSKSELEKLLNDIAVSLVITDKMDLINLNLSEIRVVLVSELFHPSISKPQNTIINISGEILMCTSGSTGEPKIVVRTWEAISHEIESILERINYCEDDRVFSLTPWTHALGFVLHFMLGIWVKARLITTRSLNTPANWAKTIEEEGVTIIVGVPTFYSYFLQASTQNIKLKLALCAGAALPKDIYNKFKSQFNIPICHYYGCTEAGAITMPSLKKECLFPSVGQPLNNVCVRIADEKGEDLKTGEIGYIHISGKSLTHKTWQNGKFTVMGYDYETGDQGVLTDQGELIIVGRNTQRIKVNGFSVLLSEIERILEQHSDILEAVIIPKTDDQRGTILVAYIRPVDKPLNVLDLRIFCQEHLAPYKIPHSYIFVKDFERDEKGQIKRTSLE